MRPLRYFAIFLMILVAHSAHARHAGRVPDRVPTIAPPAGATDNWRLSARSVPRFAAAAGDTTLLLSSSFNSGAQCSAVGWTSVDRTTAPGEFWHIDDYSGLSFGPLEGVHSLWCGVRPGGIQFCTYLTLPGYGNSWDQCWSTRDCLAVPGGATTDLDVSFAIRYDSEPSYDYTRLEYTADCTGNAGWIEIDGGYAVWDGINQTTINRSYAVGTGPVRVRLRFTSDTSWSDQDGFYNSNGAVHIDSLQAETLPIELFEDEAAGATSSNDWEASRAPGYGDYAALFRGSELLQEDACKTNVSCMWAFIQNSTENYACGGHPEQKVVPHVNSRGQYISNEIWSPWIALSGNGSQLNVQFDVYRDRLSFNSSVVFYVWHVRNLVNGCAQPWKDYNFLYEGDDKSWYKHVENVGSLVDFANASHVQVALGVIDMCPFFCGWANNGSCHSHAPLLDNVKVYRVNLTGPQWTVRGTDLFQDTFPSNSTITGKGRADEAIDIKPSGSPTFTPGDSSVINALKDGTYASGSGTNSSGLLDDPNISTYIGRHKTKKQVYMWVTVWPQGQPGKSGDALSEGPGGQANRYPHIAAKDYVDASGVTWTAIRADYTYTGTASNSGNGHPAPNAPPYVQNRFNVDLNDNLFTPGDTILFFYGASSPGGTNYYSDQWHVTNDIAEVAANPMEFTILPAGGFNRGGDILYVDGADGYGDQPYLDGALMALGIADKVDRYDVRAPASRVSNTLAGRVYNVAAQLSACYRLIMWDAGSLSQVIGDGEYPKTNDYALFGTFLGNLTQNGGIYLCGDDIAEELASPLARPAEANFRATYIPFNLISANHVVAGLGISPRVVHWPGRAFTDDAIAVGGCPAVNDFDVMNATGPSRIEMSYGAAQSTNGAVISNQMIAASATKTVVLSGFSFASIRDDELDGIFDRAAHLRDIIVFTGSGPVGLPTDAGPALRNSLAQNYPNPFNPQTTISFTIASRGHVALNVYDVSGALVRTLANETRGPGAYQVQWDGRDENGCAVASGVYFYRLVAGSFTSTRKMVLLK